jgi:thioredoxin 1
MNRRSQAIAVVAVAVAAIVVHQLRPANVEAAASPGEPSAQAEVPTLIELGSDRCIPCKTMQPVLASLRSKYGAKLIVQFIDVWKDEAAAAKYGVRAIPTQILRDSEGKEVFRHQGYFAEADIEAKFRELKLLP